MGSRAGVRRTAAQRIGVTEQEYADHVNAGRRWCFRDQAWEPVAEFGKDRTRSDGLTRSCRRSKNAAERRNYAKRGPRCG